MKHIEAREQESLASKLEEGSFLITLALMHFARSDVFFMHMRDVPAGLRWSSWEIAAAVLLVFAFHHAILGLGCLLDAVANLALEPLRNLVDVYRRYNSSTTSCWSEAAYLKCLR